MDFVIDKQYKLDVFGKQIKFPKILMRHIYESYVDYKDTFDNPYLITGEVGTGKSSMATIIGGVWQVLMNEELSIKNFTWTTEGVISFTDQKGNDGHIIIWDEAIQGGTGRDSISKIGHKLKITLVTKRRKKHFYIFIVDDLKEFNEKIIKRAKLLIDMRVIKEGFRKRRGYFKIFTTDELQELYYLLKTRAIKNIKHFRGRDNNLYRYRFKENVLINDEEYEAKKIEETNQQENQAKTWNKQQVKAIVMHYEGATYQTIAKELGVHKDTVGSWIREMKVVEVS